MAVTEKQYDALVRELKKNPGNSERHYAEATGIPQGQIGSVLYDAELEADPSLKRAATAKAVVKARADGLRWPRIAAYADISVSKAKQLYEEGSGESASDSYAGRGRNFTNGNGTSSTTKSTGASGRRQTAKTKTATKEQTGTSGRRRGRPPGSTNKPAPAGRRPAGRRGTRASANPR